MRLLRGLAAGTACLLAFTLASARADGPPDPLRLVPDIADVVLEVKNPRQLAETITQLDLVNQALALGPVREVLDSTSYRRFYQLVAYFEKQMGGRWPELVERLAGGGVVLAAKLGPNPAPALLVVQGKEEKLARRFADLGLQILEQEVARREGKERLERAQYHGVDTVRLGKEFHAAVVESSMLISNNEKTLHAALDLHRAGGKKSMAHVAALADARKLLPADPLALLWLNLETVHKDPKAKDVFGAGRDPNLTVLFGGWLDTARRSPYLCAALARESNGFLFTLRMPRGRDGGGPEQSVHVPPAGAAGLPPLLEPPGVLFSHSFYLDVGKFWDDRAKIFTPEQVQTLEDADKKSAVVLAGQKLSQLLTKAGARHRYVAANQHKTGYTRKPNQPLPAFALTIELRDPAEFTKTMNSVLRGIALLVGSQYKLKLVDAKHGNYKLIAYRFAEDAEIPQDPDGLRFNFSPCFVTVGDQFIASSTIELCHELIDLVEKESKENRKSGPAAMRTVAYAAGAAEALEIGKDGLLAQTILGRAVTLDEARGEAKAIIDLVRRLGRLGVETVYGEKDFRVNVSLEWAK